MNSITPEEYIKMTTSEKVEYNNSVINDPTATSRSVEPAQERNSRIQKSSATDLAAVISLMGDYAEGSKERDFLNMMFDTQQVTLKST